MDPPSKIIDIHPSKSTSKVIKKIHTMSWLKQDLSSKNSKTTHRAVDKDGRIISQKKTNEDYFPGTREEKKIKKKEKKGKSVVIANLEELVSLTQKNEKKSELVTESKEISIPNQQPIVQKDVEILYEINTNTTNSTAWSNISSTADKLFPNVQSVRIDRLEEEEMLSRALAESIASVQLERFKRPSPEKGNRWEALYGDKEDEGSWDNVKRNLPAGLEAPNPTSNASGQRKIRDDNNNSSKSGILRNKQQNLRRSLIEAQEHEFRFKTPSEISKDEIQTFQSLRSVSFNESIAVQVRSSESSENDESDNILSDAKKGPYIDKFGRVDGYSERRLFMGKGARIKEQEYLRNLYSLGVGDIGNLNLEGNSQATAVIKTLTPALSTSQCTRHLVSEIPMPNLENPKPEKAVAVTNVHKIPETRYQKVESNSETTAIVKTEEPALTSSQGPKNIPSQKPIPNLENSKSEDTVAVKNVHRIPETRYQKVESDSETTAIVKTEKPALKISQSANNQQSQNSVPNYKNPRNNPQKAVPLKNVRRASEPFIGNKRDGNNVKRPNECAKKSAGNKPSSKPMSLQRNNPNTGNSNRYNNQKINDSHIEIEKPDTEAKVASNLFETSSLTQREKISKIKDVKDFQGNIVSEDMISKDFLNMLQNREEEFTESNGPCLVPTLVREDNYKPNFFITNLQYTDSISTMSDAEFQSPACQNLLLAGVSCLDESCDAQSFTPHYSDPQNLQYQNYLINDLGGQLLLSQNLNNVGDIQATLPKYAKLGYAHFQHRFGAGYSPYQNIGLYVNPYHPNVSNFMDGEKTVLPNTIVVNSGPITDNKKLPAYQRTGSNRMQFLTSQAPPGFLKNLRLPSGFTRKEFTRKTNTDGKNQAIDSPAVAQSLREKFSVKQSRPQYKPQRSYERNSKTVKTGRSPFKKEPNCYRQPTARFEREKSTFTEYRKVPYPILGASEHSHEKIRDFKRNGSQTDQSSEPFRDLVNNRSTNTSENSTGLSPNNNNYLTSSTQNVNSDLDREGINDTLQNSNVISQSADPVICQMPDRLNPRSSILSNWHYNVNSFNPTQVPINLSPYYQLPVQNPQVLPANIPLDYFKSQIYTNEECQQLSMQMLSPLHMPAYSFPHLIKTEVNDAPNSPEINSVLNDEESIIRDNNCGNYNTSEPSMVNFVPNSNFYGTENMPSNEISWNADNSQTDYTTGLVFDNFNTGRGRGRLAQKNFL